MSKTIVAVIVYNRFLNLIHWLECWEKCNKNEAELVVIHNTNSDAPEYREACEKRGVQYIQRANIGFDIGAFQDLCRGRLAGFPQDWGRVLWATDDVFPMHPDFVRKFEDTMRPGVGVACMEISPYVARHIRTTGFMIDRYLAEKLTFPADPIITKQHCYLFEHQDKEALFYRQIIKMGLKVEMVANRSESPLWDTGYHRRLNRLKEHESVFSEINTGDTVLFICTVYQSYPQIISSLLLQTHKKWKLLLVHDGPETKGMEVLVPDDPRIEFVISPKRGGKWGHYIRQVAIQAKKDDADFVVVTNADNYYVPVFCEYMLKGFEQHPSAVSVYCSQMVHSYKHWQVIDCKLQRGFLDSGGVMVRSKQAAAVGWRDIETHSADWVYFSDLIGTFGPDKFHKVAGCLFTHN